MDFDFYLHSKTDSSTADFKCMIVLFDGAKKPENFNNGQSIVPTGQVADSSGWFDCKSKTYTVSVPENLTCEICTFEWRYKAPNTTAHNSVCVDMWANEVWQDDNQAGLPRVGMRFDEQEDAQNFLDELENKKSFGEGAGEWIIMISTLLLTLILLICCCAFCAKRRVSFKN